MAHEAESCQWRRCRYRRRQPPGGGARVRPQRLHLRWRGRRWAQAWSSAPLPFPARTGKAQAARGTGPRSSTCRTCASTVPTRPGRRRPRRRDPGHRRRHRRGFSHPGRFATTYRRQHGEAPRHPDPPAALNAAVSAHPAQRGQAGRPGAAGRTARGRQAARWTLTADASRRRRLAFFSSGGWWTALAGRGSAGAFVPVDPCRRRRCVTG